MKSPLFQNICTLLNNTIATGISHFPPLSPKQLIPDRSKNCLCKHINVACNTCTVVSCTRKETAGDTKRIQGYVVWVFCHRFCVWYCDNIDLFWHRLNDLHWYVHQVEVSSCVRTSWILFVKVGRLSLTPFIIVICKVIVRGSANYTLIDLMPSIILNIHHFSVFS